MRLEPTGESVLIPDKLSWQPLAGVPDVHVARGQADRGVVAVIARRPDGKWTWQVLRDFLGVEASIEDAAAAVEREWAKASRPRRVGVMRSAVPARRSQKAAQVPA